MEADKNEACGLFFAILLLGVIYDFVEMREAKWFPPDGVRNFFLIKPYTMHLSSMVYYSQEFITYIALVFHGVLFKGKVNAFFWMFVILTGMDLVDFWMTGNTEWFVYRKIPITFNIVKVFVFLLLIYYEFFQYVRSGNKFT